MIILTVRASMKLCDVFCRLGLPNDSNTNSHCHFGDFAFYVRLARRQIRCRIISENTRAFTPSCKMKNARL